MIDNQPTQEEQANIQKMISNAEDHECECGGLIFNQGIKIKKISAFDPNNKTGQSQIANVTILYCVKCFKELKI